jgi:hypothetical protein
MEEEPTLISFISFFWLSEIAIGLRGVVREGFCNFEIP